MSPVDIDLWDCFHHSAMCWPYKTAIKQDTQSYTYREEVERACKVANFLLSAHVSFQDTVAVLSPNTIPFVDVLLANAKLGLITELLNWRLAPARLCALLEASPANIVFFSQECKTVYEYLNKHLSRKVLFVCMDGYVDGSVSARNIYTQNGVCPVVRPFVFSDSALRIYSSGTTGMPKAMLHSVKNLVMKAMLYANVCKWSPDDVCVLTSPFFHISVIALFTCFFAGSTCIIGNPRSESMALAIEENHATRIGVVPTTLNALLDYIEAHPELDCSSVRFVEYGASPMSAKQIDRCMKVLNCQLFQCYGMTETVGTITCLLPEQHRQVDKLSSVGLPIPGTQIRVVDPNGKECPCGREGEIVVRHPCTIDSYLMNPQLTEQVIHGEWFYTGDMGYLDEDGFLFLVDRKHDMIISGGENVYPSEISSCIRMMSDEIRDVAVTGVPDEWLGEAIMAAVVKRPGSQITAEEICAHCKAHLGSYKKPRYVYFVDALPLNNIGKVDRNAVKQLHISARH